MEWGNLLTTILENLAKLIPGRMINDYERGVRYTRGRPRHTQLGAGWWWFVPLYQSIKIVSVKDQVKDIATQSVTTRDDVSVSASLCIEYEIFDAVLWQNEVHEFDESLHGLSKIYLSRAFRVRDYAYLRTHQRRVEHAMERALGKHAREWGVLIRTVGLETFVKARQFRIMGDPPSAKDV